MADWPITVIPSRQDNLPNTGRAALGSGAGGGVVWRGVWAGVWGGAVVKPL